jgi:diguanylate cyclase
MPNVTANSRKSLDLLETLGCEPSPRAYAVAYAYVQDPAGPLAVDMMSVVTRRKRLGAAEVDRLFEAHLSKEGNAFADAAGTLGRHIGTTMDLVGASIASARGASDRMTALVAEEAGEDALRAVVTGLLEEQGALWRQLRETNGELDRMRDRYERMVDESRKDPLTEMANRRVFDDHLARDVARSARTGSPVCLLMIDIDHFKSVNDSFGHHVGDQVIKLIGKTLREAVRTSDVAARLGGEEYGIILSDAPLDKACEVAERIRRTIDGYKSISGGREGRQHKVTVSIGVSAFQPGDDPTSLYVRADACLYAAKRQGRNRVVSAPGPAASAEIEPPAGPSP